MVINKPFFKKLIYLLAVMAVITVVSVIICAIGAKNKAPMPKDDGSIKVVTSFQPMYILTKNLLQYTGAEVTNMTTGLSGCIHDYQVTTEDMRKLSQADVFVVNGMGMESFLSKIVAKNPKLPVFSASGDMDEDEEDHGGHVYEENGHLWMNPHTYLDELNNLHGQFTDYFLEHGTEGQLNGLILAYNEYGQKVLKLMARYDDVQKNLPDDLYVICYNEAFELFAEGLGINIISVFSLDEDEMPSAGEIADAINEAKKHDKVLIFIEKDLAFHAEKVVKETGAAVVYLDPLTGGAEDMDSYISGTLKNIDSVENIIK